MDRIGSDRMDPRWRTCPIRRSLDHATPQWHATGNPGCLPVGSARRPESGRASRAGPAAGRNHPHAARALRAAPRRQLLLAQGPEQPEGHRLPRRRERLHRRADGLDQGAPAGALRRDRRPDQAGRHDRAGFQQRLPLLLTVRDRQAVPDPGPQEGFDGGSRGDLDRRECPGRGSRLFFDDRRQGQPRQSARRLRGRHRRPPLLYDSRQGLDDRPAARRHDSQRHPRTSSGPTTAGRSSTPGRIRTRSEPTAFTVTAWVRHPPAIRSSTRRPTRRSVAASRGRSPTAT